MLRRNNENGCGLECLVVYFGYFIFVGNIIFKAIPVILGLCTFITDSYLRIPKPYVICEVIES